jgi:hypothetical protein
VCCHVKVSATSRSLVQRSPTSRMRRTWPALLTTSTVPYLRMIQGGSNMTRTNCDLFTHKSSRSYLNHLVYDLWHHSISKTYNSRARVFKTPYLFSFFCVVTPCSLVCYQSHTVNTLLPYPCTKSRTKLHGITIQTIQNV